MPSSTPPEITPSDVITLRKMLAWIRGFKVTGDGVKFRRTSDSCIVHIDWPRRSSETSAADEDYFCKIDADFTVASVTINAKRCKEDGTLLPDVTDAETFNLTGSSTQKQAYCNLKAGDVVPYEPLASADATTGAIGRIKPQPIVGGATDYSVMQSAPGNRVVFDVVRMY